MITNIRGYYTATCDICGAELDSVFRRSEAVYEMERAGWDCKYTEAGWFDVCAKCKKWNAGTAQGRADIAG